MNPRDNVILNLRRQDMDYQKQIREALLNVEALIGKDCMSAGKLLNEFVFCEKNKPARSINSTQEAQLTVVLLSDYFVKDDPNKIPFFFKIFDPAKPSRKSLLLKFILTAIAINSSAVSESVSIMSCSLKDSLLLGIKCSCRIFASSFNKRFPYLDRLRPPPHQRNHFFREQFH